MWCPRLRCECLSELPPIELLRQRLDRFIKHWVLTQMNIKEFSKISGISTHTLRYYEKIGIFQEVNRNDSGHRVFSENDLLWAEFINRLKETGMPLKQMKKYAVLRKQGEHTAEARMKLLINHATALKRKISVEKQHLKKISEKIEYYENFLINKIPLD